MEAAFDTDYFLCVVSEEPYDRQFVLFIAAEEGDVRGMGPGEIYPIGRNYPASEEQSIVMRSTADGKPRGAQSKDGKYLDYYTYLGSVDEHQLMLVIARDITKVQNEIVYRIIQFGSMLLLFLCVLAVLCLLTIQFVALRPLKKIQESINLYRVTKDNEAVRKTLREVKSDNELGILSDDVAAMADEIDAYTERIETITSERERIDVELSLASRIQQAMLPKIIPADAERKDYEICASMTPAKEVGGDFYDFFLIDDTHLCILIADVSGKGIPASLYMMASRISLSHHIKTGKQPAEVFDAVNRAICERNPEEMFLTAWIGILDLSTGKLTAANAGHENPLLMQPDKPYIVFKDIHNFVLGGMADVKYRGYEIEMKPGSRLFLYTDGLTEAANDRDEMFGMTRILKELNSTRNEPPKEVLDHMKKTVDQFAEGREPFDDLTMISLVYNGPLTDLEKEQES